MNDDTKHWSNTMAAQKARLKALRAEDDRRRIEEDIAQRKAKALEWRANKLAARDPNIPIRPKMNDPRMAAFKMGDLVQVTALGIKRQRRSAVPKDINTKGIYYGPCKKNMVYVDWLVAEPWEHRHRQAICIDYLEPLGTSRD